MAKERDIGDERGLAPSAQAFARSIAEDSQENFILRLYISGMTPRSRQAIENIRRLCEQYLNGRFELEIIDIYQQPALAKQAQVIAAPTLVRTLPLPLKKIIGDMCDEKRIITALGISELR